MLVYFYKYSLRLTDIINKTIGLVTYRDMQNTGIESNVDAVDRNVDRVEKNSEETEE